MIFVEVNYIIDFDLFLMVVNLFLSSCSSCIENIRGRNDFKGEERINSYHYWIFSLFFKIFFFFFFYLKKISSTIE